MGTLTIRGEGGGIMLDDNAEERLPESRRDCDSWQNRFRDSARWLIQCREENAPMLRGARLLEIVIRNRWATVKRNE